MAVRAELANLFFIDWRNRDDRFIVTGYRNLTAYEARLPDSDNTRRQGEKQRRPNHDARLAERTAKAEPAKRGRPVLLVEEILGFSPA